MSKKSEADWKKEQEFARATVKLTMTPAEILDAVVEDDFRFAVENDEYIKDLIRRSMEDDTEDKDDRRDANEDISPQHEQTNTDIENQHEEIEEINKEMEEGYLMKLNKKFILKISLPLWLK